MPCTYCSAQFNIARWKSACNKCTKKYCSECMKSGVCKSCGGVMQSNLCRRGLMELKVKDLRLYLINRNQPTEDCKEKYELVKLIQTFHGIYEPDLGSHTESYNTTFTSSLGNDGTSTHSNDSSSFPQSSASASSAMPDLHPPTYQQTQESYPSARQFSPRVPTSSDTQNEANSTAPKKSPPKEFPDIIDINSLEELRALSIKQLKFILRNNFVNFQGVLEKQDLILRAETLFIQHQKDNDSVKADTTKEVTMEVNDANFCKICWDNAVNCVFLECGHMVTCIDCSKLVVECPVCRQNIVRKVRVFKS